MDISQWQRFFARRLWQYMQAEGITQQELSKLSGVSQASISGYLRNSRVPAFPAVANIAHALSCDIADFIGPYGYIEM